MFFDNNHSSNDDVWDFFTGDRSLSSPKKREVEEMLYDAEHGGMNILSNIFRPW